MRTNLKMLSKEKFEVLQLNQKVRNFAVCLLMVTSNFSDESHIILWPKTKQVDVSSAELQYQRKKCFIFLLGS